MRWPAAKIGVDLNLPESHSVGPWTRALHTAIERTDLEAVTWALRKGADPGALIPFSIYTHEEDQIIVKGGYNALHALMIQTFPEHRPPEETACLLPLPVLDALLATGMEVNIVTEPWPQACDALEILLWGMPKNTLEALGRLIQHGAVPRPQAFDVLLTQHPDLQAVPALAALVEALPFGKRAAVLNRIDLKALTDHELAPMQWLMLMELVKHGLDLDQAFPGRRTKIGTPAQAIACYNPDGDALVELLRNGNPAAIRRPSRSPSGRASRP